MEQYQLRVIEEKEELDIKIKGLQNFIESDKFDNLPNPEKRDMEKQLTHMRVYTNVLQSRINRF